MSRDRVAGLVYGGILCALAYATYSRYKRSYETHRSMVSALQREMAQLQRDIQDMKAIKSRPYAYMVPKGSLAVNDVISWDGVVHMDTDVFAQSNDGQTVEIRRDGNYLITVRCKYSSAATDIPRLIALLHNGVVLVQYVGQRHGCFGPTEILSLRTGDTLSVEYYGGQQSETSIESGSIDFTAVML